MSRTIGYVRVSTVEQDACLQRDALNNLRPAPVEIIEDIVSDSRADRPGLIRALALLEPGDTLAVWRLDHLSRTFRELIDTAKTIREKGAALKSLSEAIDTGTAGDRALFHVLDVLAEFERETIRERVTAGMAAAKRAGIHTGRPGKMTAARTTEARNFLEAGKSWNEVCRLFDISQSTLSRALARYPKQN